MKGKLRGPGSLLQGDNQILWAPWIKTELLSLTEVRVFQGKSHLLFFLCIAVSRAVREATYPFLALICLRDNRMTVVGRMEGEFGAVGKIRILIGETAQFLNGSVIGWKNLTWPTDTHLAHVDVLCLLRLTNEVSFTFCRSVCESKSTWIDRKATT